MIIVTCTVLEQENVIADLITGKLTLSSVRGPIAALRSASILCVLQVISDAADVAALMVASE